MMDASPLQPKLTTEETPQPSKKEEREKDT